MENGLIFVAITGIQDPLRPEIKESIQLCKDAGITVRMVTGDNIETARAIALDAGILRKEDLKDEWACVEGSKFRTYVGEVVGDTDPKSGKTIERPTDTNKFEIVASKLKVLA